MFFFFSSRRRHTRCYRDWSSDVCSSDLRRMRRSTRKRAQSPRRHLPRMPKRRVHEIAKQQGLTSKEVLAALNAAGIEAKVAASSVEEEDALKVLAAAGSGDGAAAASKAKPAAKKPKPAAKKPAAKKPK